MVCILFLGSFIKVPYKSKTDTVKIYGNCSMCKTTIEKALKNTDGIISKNWNVETKILTVTYDPAKINLNVILQKIANLGYDSDAIRAKDEVYNKLPACCHYERPKK
jgi:copper chaperone CopZ